MKANREISLRAGPHYRKVQSEALNARWVYRTQYTRARTHTHTHTNATYRCGVLSLWQQELQNNRLLGLTPCNMADMYGRFSDSKMPPPSSGYCTIVTRWRALKSEGRRSVPERGAGFSLLYSILIVGGFHPVYTKWVKGELSPSLKQPDVQKLTPRIYLAPKLRKRGDASPHLYKLL
jgi:hypothetical protein